MLRALVVGGLVVWTMSAIATEAVFRLRFDPFGVPPSGAPVVADLVGTLAFRVWVAALVLLILPRLPLRASGSA